MCFLHALMNAKQLKEAGHEVKIVLEGMSCLLPKELEEEKCFISALKMMVQFKESVLLVLKHLVSMKKIKKVVFAY